MPEELVPVNGTANTGWKHLSTTVHRIEELWALDDSGTSIRSRSRSTFGDAELIVSQQRQRGSYSVIQAMRALPSAGMRPLPTVRQSTAACAVAT